ncbi:MAG: LysM peptidoglycan-binding domain-containing protein, partial [Deltaproteobacteria bacterium]|nr:LysM peptidoglycan-binding domain-containing protein [Deltaproteobacteria bacterium]
GESNAGHLTSQGGLGAIGRTGVGITVFDATTNSNQVIREYDFGGVGSDTIFTPDLSRLYGTGYHKIAVIDTITFEQVDADPSTPELDYITLPGNTLVARLAMDPAGHFLFAAGHAAAVYVIDIRPNSFTFHEVVGTINLPRDRISIQGLAVNADGTQLLVGTGTSDDQGHLTIYKLHPDNEPSQGGYIVVPGDNLTFIGRRYGLTWQEIYYHPDNEAFRALRPDPNLIYPGDEVYIPLAERPFSGYFELLVDHQLDSMPFDIKATTDPRYATMTYRYRIASLAPWGSFGTAQRNLQQFSAVTLTDTGPELNHIRTQVEGGNLKPLVNSVPGNYYTGYYQNILTPRDVVVMPDLSAAFIADWEVYLVHGYGGQRGDKVGVVSDPFTDPKYLGATTPIDMAFVTSVAVSPAGDRVFVSYSKFNEILVMDAQKLIAAGTALDPKVAERTPLDQIDPSIHITPVTVVGLLQGMSTQAGDFVKLKAFGTGDQLRRVRLDYEIHGPNNLPLSSPLKVKISAIRRGELNTGGLIELGEVTIGPDTIGAGQALHSLEGQLPEQALLPGEHTVYLDPSVATWLRNGLEDRDYEILVAVADPDVCHYDDTVEFGGYYQASSGTRGVLRTGSQLEDQIEIGQDDQISWSTAGSALELAQTFVSASDILIFTSERRDEVRHASSDPNQLTQTKLIVYAGGGPDIVYGGRGDDELFAGTESDLALTEFNVLVGEGGGDLLEGSDSKDILLGDGFDFDFETLKNFARDLAKGRIRLASIDLTATGNGDDTLNGNDGFDVLIGGHGTDKLDAGKGLGSIMLGDSFEVSAAIDIDLGLFFSTDFDDFLTDLVKGGLAPRLDGFVDIGLVGNGGDTIKGEGIFDFALGGDGADTIDFEKSQFAIAFGGKGGDTLKAAKIGSLLWGDGFIADESSTDC